MANANTDPFDAYFKRADLDGDGKISGAEAVAFFQGSGLPKEVLAQVWTYANQKNAAYLDRQDFYNALKLVTVAQRKRDLTPDIVKAALFSPASAKIPPPQINLAAAPTPRVATHSVGVRPPLPQDVGNAGINQQYFVPHQSQFPRPPQPSGTASRPLQVSSMPLGVPMSSTRPPNSTGVGGSIGGSITQVSNRATGPAVTQDGFGMTGLRPVQRGPQVNSGQMVVTLPEPQDAATASNQAVAKDSKVVGVSGNGFSPDSLFKDVFSETAAQPKQSLSSATSSASSLPVASALVPPPIGPQTSVKPNSLDSLQSTLSQQPFSGQSTERQGPHMVAQNTMSHSSTGFPLRAVNSLSSPSQPPWPKMTQSNIQKYMKVFALVDTDRDGNITGEQARNLFLSWRLPREVLKQVWDLSDQDSDGMLSLREFCISLYLMERHREGHPLPTTLPGSIAADEVLLSATGHPTASYGSGTWRPAPGIQQPQVVTGTRPPRPPMPHPVPHGDEKQRIKQKPKVPMLEKHLVDQLSQEEQDSLNSKFEEATRADKKVEELEKEISDSRQKIEFYRVKMQELILYKSRCDSRLNEVMERVSADKREVESLSKKYEEKYRQGGDVASKLTIEEATFYDIQEKKMELYRAIVKMEEGGTADGVIKERAEQIQSSLEEQVKSVIERCKQYGLRAKPTSLLELPFGWQPGIQAGAADWDEDWDKFEDEGFTIVKELTLDVQNVVAPPKQKSSVQNGTSSTNGDLGASSSDAEPKSEKVASADKLPEKESSPHGLRENGGAKFPPDSPAERSGASHGLRDSPFREGASVDDSPRAKEIQSDVGAAEPVLSGDKNVDEPGWGTFDSHYDTESVWGFDSASVKDMDHSLGEFGLNPIKTGSSHGDNMYKGKAPFIFADSVPSTPAYDPRRSSFPFADSVPSTPAYNQGKNSYASFADSVPGTPAYNTGKSPFTFAESVPGTPAYNFGNSPRRFSDGPDDQSFDSLSRFDSYSMHDSGLFQSPRHSLSRFDSSRSTRDADQSYGFPSRYDSFGESGDTDQSHGFSRFDSFRDSDQGHGFSKFDSFKDADHSHGFPSSFDAFGESRDSDHKHMFSRFDSFSSHDGGFSKPSRDSDNSHGFSSFDDSDPFGSSGPFRTSLESETPRKSADNWRAF